MMLSLRSVARTALVGRAMRFVTLLTGALLMASGAGAQDADSDGFLDADDNCINVANALQIDADLDAIGNACDPDYNNDGVVGIPDYAFFLRAFPSAEGDANYDPRAEHSRPDSSRAIR